MRIIALALLLVATPALAGGVSGPAGRVVDGDTLYVGRTKIRLCGIDAPERLDPAGPAATAALRALVQGRQLRCVAVGDGTPCDGRSSSVSYDRLVAQCFADGRDLAAEMVRRGQAVDYPRYSGGFYSIPSAENPRRTGTRQEPR